MSATDLDALLARADATEKVCDGLAARLMKIRRAVAAVYEPWNRDGIERSLVMAALYLALTDGDWPSGSRPLLPSTERGCEWAGCDREAECELFVGREQAWRRHCREHAAMEGDR